MIFDKTDLKMAQRWKKLPVKSLANEIAKFRMRVYDRAHRRGRNQERSNPTPNWYHL